MEAKALGKGGRYIGCLIAGCVDSRGLDIWRYGCQGRWEWSVKRIGEDVYGGGISRNIPGGEVGVAIMKMVEDGGG